MITLLLVSAAGGFGAAARFLLDGVLRERVPVRWPLGTLVVNLTGSLLLGLLTGLALASLVPAGWQLVLGTGFLGGYTTFSTASVETLRLLQQRRSRAALAYAFGAAVLAVLAAALGLALPLLT